MISNVNNNDYNDINKIILPKLWCRDNELRKYWFRDNKLCISWSRLGSRKLEIINFVSRYLEILKFVILRSQLPDFLSQLSDFFSRDTLCYHEITNFVSCDLKTYVFHMNILPYSSESCIIIQWWQKELVMCKKYCQR